MINHVINQDFEYFQYIDKEVCLLAFTLEGLIKQAKTIYNINLLTLLN